jgi:hypothetical protein
VQRKSLQIVLSPSVGAIEWYHPDRNVCSICGNDQYTLEYFFCHQTFLPHLIHFNFLCFCLGYWIRRDSGELSNLEHLDLNGSMSGTIPAEMYVLINTEKSTWFDENAVVALHAQDIFGGACKFLLMTILTM